MRYTSSTQILGWPLIDVRVADARTPRSVARGWIAVGDIAVGHLFAAGGVATGFVAVGGLAIGVIPLGGLALGLFAVGGGAIGIWSVGGAALGLQAALGGLAVAAQFALGGAAFAQHANDSQAVDFFARMPFTAIRYALMHARWLILLALLPLIPALRRRPPDGEGPGFR